MKADHLTNSVESLPPLAMSKFAADIGVYKTNKQPHETVMSAITAGVFISIAFLFYITVTTGASSASFGMTKLIGGICFSMGLMLVVICGADLFTSTILTCVAKVTKRITWWGMFRNWLLVYFGNLIGALFFVLLVWIAGLHMTANGLWGLNVLNTASHKLEHTFLQAVTLGILANIMVCLAAWMSYAGRSLLDKALIMILPVAMFVASGFEHSIANMFMIPIGIVIENFAGTEFWLAIGVNPEQFAHLTVNNFIYANLIPVTIGNIIGGLLVGLTYWAIYLRRDTH